MKKSTILVIDLIWTLLGSILSAVAISIAQENPSIFYVSFIAFSGLCIIDLVEYIILCIKMWKHKNIEL